MTTRVDGGDLRRFVVAVLEAHGVPPEHAELCAEVLVAADLAGIDSHGVSRLGFYTHKLRGGHVNPTPEPTIAVDNGSACVIDGDNGLGMVAGRMGMDLAIERAAEGVAASVSVGHSNHYGIAGWYALRAVEHGMIGISMTNSATLVAPTFGRTAMLGTNPIAIAVPTGTDRPFLLDMATSTVAAGKLQLAMATGDPIPEGWAIDADGDPTTDPGVGFGGALLPLGSSRSHGSHKGYGLAVVVDIFSALLSGANFGAGLPGLVREFNDVSNVGHFFAAIRVEAFLGLEEFAAKMRTMIGDLHGAPTAPGEEQVLVAGEPELDERARRERDGIPLDETTVTGLRVVAESCGLTDRADDLLGT